MKEILQNIEKDIETVERILKRLRADKRHDPQAGLKIVVYEDILNELYDNSHAVRQYLQKEEVDK